VKALSWTILVLSRIWQLPTNPAHEGFMDRLREVVEKE